MNFKLTKFPIVVNLFGGPGIGKSRIALELAGKLKSQGFDVEYVDEWIKEAAWLGYHDLFNQPDVIAANQRRKLETVKNHCTIVVTDSPLILTIPYAQHYMTDWPQEAFEQLVLHLFKQYDNYNIWVNRNPAIYRQTGRRETIEQAAEIDGVIEKYVTGHINFDLVCDNDNDVIKYIEHKLMSDIKQQLDSIGHPSNKSMLDAFKKSAIF